MKIFLKSIYGIFLLSILSACVPIPTKNTVIPNVSGRLNENGKALSSYVVKLAYGTNDACSSKNSVAQTTDNDGKFYFKSTYSWSMIRWAVPLDSLDYFSLCFVSPKGNKSWAYISHIRTPSWAPNIELVCKVNQLYSESQQFTSPFDVVSNCEKERS